VPTGGDVLPCLIGVVLYHGVGTFNSIFNFIGRERYLGYKKLKHRRFK
jgi:hypothetical protein